MSRTVLVTGASGGIGGAAALAFAHKGERLVLCYHTNAEAALDLQNQIQALGGEAVALAADVADENQVEALFCAAEERFGPVQVLVNGAGFAQQKLATDITPGEWRRMLEVHATGSFLCCRRALPAMVRAKSGCIVNISSIWGQVGASCEVHYSAAKAAVIGLTRALAKEVAPSGVRVNCVAPGAVDTPMMEGFSPEDQAAFCEAVPLGRLAAPGEVAAVVAFLASDEASYLTGQVLSPNGGMW